MFKKSVTRGSDETTPLIFISGSYKNNRLATLLSKRLGEEFAIRGWRIISAASRPAHVIGQALQAYNRCNKIDTRGQITTCFRIKHPPVKRAVHQHGNVWFFELDPHELKQEIVQMCDVVIVIGGKKGTNEEVQLAHKYRKTIVPIACTGGIALEVWEQYRMNIYKFYMSDQPIDAALFDALKDKNISRVVKSVVELIRSLKIKPD